MGIDIYMKWKGMTEEEEEARYTGFSTVHGHVGYLREAYHGGPYATRMLVPEAFEEHGEVGVTEDDDIYVPIPAATMRARLPEVVEAAKRRERRLYDGTPKDCERRAKAFTDFVELAERKERETGEPVRVFASW